MKRKVQRKDVVVKVEEGPLKVSIWEHMKAQQNPVGLAVFQRPKAEQWRPEQKVKANEK